jgi:hypothetical protein
VTGFFDDQLKQTSEGRRHLRREKRRQRPALALPSSDRSYEPRLRLISLGAGVQSTTLALMAAHGEIGPMPDAAIFADTGAEPKAVYNYLEWLMSGNVLPFPVHVVSVGNIKADITNADRGKRTRFAAVPFFLKSVDPQFRDGMGRRQCTREYKIDPLRKKQRELLGYKPRERIPPKSVEVWIGISWDEQQRMKDAPEAWQVNRWPLIEKEMIILNRQSRPAHFVRSTTTRCGAICAPMIPIVGKRLSRSIMPSAPMASI